MTRKEAIKLGDMALRCIAHDFNLGRQENYDGGYHVGKFLAYMFAASLYSTQEAVIIEINAQYPDRVKDVCDIFKSRIVIIYPELYQKANNKHIWFVMSKSFFEDVLKDVEEEQGKPLVDDIRKNCVICE